MREPVIVAYGRGAVGKAPKGSLKYTRTEKFTAQILLGVLAKVPNLPYDQIEDIVMGCAFPEAEQGLNLGRTTSGLAGLPDSVAAMTINRFCSSGIQTISTVHNSILAGDIDVGIGGGADSMSLVPGGGNMNFPEAGLMRNHVGHYLSMGITAENVAEKYNISREKQDVLALRSHLNAENAQKSGYFTSQIVPVKAVRPLENGTGSETFTFDKDEGIRYGATLEGMTGLRPVFKKDGTVTAGNSSQMSDGAGFVVVMERERAKELNIPPIARIAAYAVVGVDPGIMGIGPIAAIPKALKKAGMTLADIDLIELNEAFAAQAVACIETLELPEEKVNVNGGAIALGHPLGGSGAVLSCKMFSELQRRGKSTGLVSMCVGGGMGACIVYEML